METISVALIVEGNLKKVLIQKEMLSGLALKLREEGKCFVHTVIGSYEAEGLVVTGKGSKNGIIILPNINE